MHVRVRTRGLPSGEAAAKSVPARLRSALGPLSGRVRRATVGLEGAAGGVPGARCRCVVTLAVRPRGTILAQGLADDVDAAVTRAVAEAAERARRRLGHPAGIV